MKAGPGLAVALCAIAACRSTADPGALTAAAPRAVEPANAAPAPAAVARVAGATLAPRPTWSPGDAVRVRLSGASDRVEVDGTRTGALVLRREKDEVVASGGERARELTVEPRDPRRGLFVGGRRYVGALVARAGRESGALELEIVCDIEDYVAGVVAAELPLWSALPAELEAQAIAARSYAACALRERSTRTNRPYLFDDTRDQAFGGASELAQSPARREVAAKAARAVAATRGRVLVEDGRVVDARFHACCGGRTADARDVAPEANFQCLRSVACEPCSALATGSAAQSDGVRWSWTASRDALAAFARALALGARVERLQPAQLGEDERWLTVRISGSGGERTLRFEELRERLPAGALKSNRITSTWPRAGEPISAGMRFEGLGRGHGVGLCQVGAHGYAERGWSAERILGHYFPGARVAPLAGAE